MEQQALLLQISEVSTLQKWRDDLGFFGESFRPLSSITLGKFQENWTDCKMIIIDEYSMLRQKKLHFANERTLYHQSN
jgi:hypothetical protein